VIARMLVCQDTDHAAGAKQFDRAMESVAPVEHFDARPSARAPDMLVDVAIAKLLVNSREPDVIDIVREHLREKFPVADVAQDDDNWPSSA
jgi:hypothetical protein